MLGSNTLQLMPVPMWLADESMHGTEIKSFTAILRYKRITETEFKEAAKDACGDAESVICDIGLAYQGNTRSATVSPARGRTQSDTCTSCCHTKVY